MARSVRRGRMAVAPARSWLALVGIAVLVGLFSPHGTAAAQTSGEQSGTPSGLESRSGVATFTDLTGGGACGFPGEPPDNLHVGLSSPEYGAAAVCGGYLDVTGPTGTVRVKITDHCVACPFGQLDLTRKAFGTVADVQLGRVAVTYLLVRDPPLTDPISLLVKARSSGSWLDIQALDHGNPLASVEIATPGGGWRGLAHTEDNFWRAESPGPGEGPFTVRITDIYGQSATVDGVTLSPGVVQRTNAQLYPVAAATPGPGAPSTTVTPVTPPAVVTVPTGPDITVATPGAASSGSASQSASPATRTYGSSDESESVVTVFVLLGATTLAWRAVLWWQRRRQHVPIPRQ